MNQGDIWYADIEPVKGSEQSGKRLVVIISGPAMNTLLPIVIACPLTSVIKNIKGCVVLKKNQLNNLKKDSEILVLQVRAISKQRLTKKIGSLSPEQMDLVKEGINIYLNY